VVTAPAPIAPSPPGAPAGSRGIDEILAAARSRLTRLDPAAAHRAQRDGAVLVDIRPVAQRAAHGEIPGALAVERNVLEWRFDPRSAARLTVAGSYDLAVIVLCQEGYTSSLAAAALQEIGLHRATDLTGGFAAWQAAGLPVLAPH
jgi:rhodanese-related sulfurtransferase